MVDVTALQEALNAETARAQQIALNDHGRVRTARHPQDHVRVTEAALVSAVSYQSFLDRLQTDVLPSGDGVSHPPKFGMMKWEGPRGMC